MAIAGLTCAIIGAIVAATLFIIVYNRAKDCADEFDTGTSDYRVCLRWAPRAETDRGDES